jgi:adenylate kinase
MLYQRYERLPTADCTRIDVVSCLTIPQQYLYLPSKLIVKENGGPGQAAAKFIKAMFNLILFGPPGSGKGTQSEKLIDKYGLVHLSTGNLLREEIANSTELGLAAKSFMDKGQLVPDEVVLGMIACALDNNVHANGFLFDGFPRTVAQARGLDEMLEQRGAEINLVLALDVSEQELVKRLVNRGKTSDRSDDNEEVIRARFHEYEKKTAPVAGHYAALGKVINVKGEGSVDEIFQALSGHINSRSLA